jgi:endonuclease III
MLCQMKSNKQPNATQDKKTQNKKTEAQKMDEKFLERKVRLAQMLKILKKKYPEIQSEMTYSTPMQFVACVILSAQFTDKGVNRLTDILWKKYTTVDDFANSTPEKFAQEIKSVSYFNSKARYIVETARIIRDTYAGVVPNNKAQLVAMPGIGSKTANVVLSELYGVGSGIAVDVHVKRFVYRFNLCAKENCQNATIIERELCALVPQSDWRWVNHCLVMYGRHECTARRHDCAGHAITKVWPEAASRWRVDMLL